MGIPLSQPASFRIIGSMKSILPRCLFAAWLATPALCAEPPPTAEDLAGKRVVFLGDSITQAGGYVSFVSYFLEKRHPGKSFDILGLGLSSETLSCLSEDGHAGGRFPRPCLSERLGRVLEKAKPEVVFACYGMNDGIYLPLDEKRFAAFRDGVGKLIADCKAAGVEDIFLITPPIHDSPSPEKEPGYDAVLVAYSAWEMSLEKDGVHVIDLHTAMRKARDARTEVFSKDRVHPGEEGHLLMAEVILGGLGMKAPFGTLAEIKADPLFNEVAALRKHRSEGWMRHTGYTREKVVAPQPLGDTEEKAAEIRRRIDALRAGG